MIDEGITRADKLEAIPTEIPPVPAGALRATLQFVEAEGKSNVSAQETELSDGTTAPMVPPVAEIAIGSPPAVAPSASVRETLTPIPARVTFTDATIPFIIGFAFMPLAKQIYTPPFAAQVIVLPAAVKAGPAVTEISTTLPAG